MAKLAINKYELAALLGDDFKVSWIEEKCRTRQIPHLLIAGQYRFTEEHVAAIIAMHERAPKPQQAVTEPAPTAPPQRRTRGLRPLPTGQAAVTPLRDRGLPMHRVPRSVS